MYQSMQRKDVPAVESLDAAHCLTQMGKGGGGGKPGEENKQVQVVGHDNGSHYAQKQHGVMVQNSKGDPGSGGKGGGGPVPPWRHT